MKLNRNLCKLNINFACVKLSIIMIFIITYTVVFLFRFMYLEEIMIDVNEKQNLRQNNCANIVMLTFRSLTILVTISDKTVEGIKGCSHYAIATAIFYYSKWVAWDSM